MLLVFSEEALVVVLVVWVVVGSKYCGVLCAVRRGGGERGEEKSGGVL